MDTTSNRLKQAMDMREMKQVDIIERTGISKGALSSYLSGRYVPKQNNIHALAVALDVSESWLMGYDVDPHRVDASVSAPAADPVLSDRDIALLEKYHSLNALGKDKLDERADELCEMEKYKKDVANSVKAG
jgi:transcriptional regulator with XRE-family HTH domain